MNEDNMLEREQNEFFLPQLEFVHSKGMEAFINHWRKLYDYENPKKYAPIENNVLTEQDLLSLYEWKNGMVLSEKKLISLQSKILSKITLINQLRGFPEIDLESFLREFKSVSTVWKIFLLHILKPDIYPIYDQHVHRAFLFIQGRPYAGIRSTMPDGQKLRFYFDEYLPFVTSLGVSSLKEMDEAFFALGQFLNTRNQNQLFKR